MSSLCIVLAIASVEVTTDTSAIREMVSIPFFEVYLSTFLGFLSALIVEAINDYVTSNQKRKQIVKNLTIELETVKSEAASLEDTKLYPLPYSIPFWKGISLSGLVLSLDKMDNYSELIRIFEKIEEGNQIEGRCFDIVMSSQNKNIDECMFETILKNRKRLINEIDKGLELLKEAM